MGYTHYYYRVETLDKGKFKAWAEDVKKIISVLPKKKSHNYDGSGPQSCRIVNGYGDPGTEPTITDELVSFNGEGKWSHETFYVTRVFDEGYRQTNDQGFFFSFCKTAQKPYDIAVVACLIRFAYHFPEGCEIASDGTVEEWEPGRRLVEDLFGLAVIPLRLEEGVA